MIARALIVLSLMVAAAVYTSRAGAAEEVAVRAPLAALPLEVGGWHGRDSAPFADDVVAQLGVDDYVNRHYARPARSAPLDTSWDGRTGLAGPPATISLYAGYYASQRQGDTIHSPQNCLPGAGWHPVASGRMDLDAAGRVLRVNRYVIQKGLDRQVVLYWYQGRGRVVASEYANKALLMLDAARLNRTGGGLVRVMTPVVTTAEAATDELAAFVTALFPHLERHLP
jgi:EpsI family protein